MNPIKAAQSAPVYANLGGIIMYGPAQKSFFSVMCSLLPTSLPSLFATHLTTMRGSSSSSVLWEASRRLGFQSRMPVVYLPRPQEVVAGDYPGKKAFFTYLTRVLHCWGPATVKPKCQPVLSDILTLLLGSEIWRLIQTIENVKASIDSLINGPGYTSYFNQYLQKTQRVSFYRLETIQSKLTKLNDEFETNKLKLIDELKKVEIF